MPPQLPLALAPRPRFLTLLVEPLRLRRGAPLVGQPEDLDGEDGLPDRDLEPVAHPHVLRGLHALAVHVDAAAGDGLGGQ